METENFNKRKSIQVLYLFAGERKILESRWREGVLPDSQMIGFNHLKEFGVEATYIENRFLNFIRKKNFNLTNLLLLPFLCRYDIVFSGASLWLPLVAKVFLRFKKPKFIWYNTFFTNAVKRNRHKRFRFWMLRKAIGSLDAIVCPSTAQRRFLVDEGFDPAKIFFAPNGIDLEFMNKKPAGETSVASGREPFLLSVGKDMGRDYKTLAEAVSGLPIKVKVAALMRNFKDVAKIPPNLEILGFVSFDRLLELYRGALFVVVPTKSERYLDASDCSGQTVLLDAMSVGKAVIASRRETLVDYFVDGQEGLVVSPEDPAALRAAMLQLLEDKSLAARLGAQAKIRSARFSTRRLAEDLATIFKSI